MTILSVNKTRDFGVGAVCAHFFVDGRAVRPFFIFPEEVLMTKKTRFLVHAALIAALYAALTHMQNFLLPGSATWAIQFRASEALCILAFFTPAAIPGLAIGCLVFNLSCAGALPLDFLVGTLASGLSAGVMWLTRGVTVRRFPALGMCMPALFNALLVGWELTVYIGGGFCLNALYVAIGEAAVLFTLGTALYLAMKHRHLDTRLFG